MTDGSGVERMNLLLLTVDAWRPDFVEEYGGVRLTPSLELLGPRWVTFPRAWSTGPWTTPGLVSIFTGQSAARHGVACSWSAPRQGGPALFRTLREAGWATPNLSYLNRLDNYSNLGFSREDAPGPPESSEDPLLEEAIRSTPEPFALWYHYKFLHLPYWAPDRFRERMGVLEVPEVLRQTVGSLFVAPRGEVEIPGEHAETVRRLYAAGVLELDEFLARTFRALRSRGALDRTVVVLTSDHGEELLDHGHVGHASTAHGATLYEEVLRIPLLVADPRVPEPRRVEGRVQGSDLYRTLLGLLGRPDPDGEGLDLSGAVLGGEARIPRDRILSFHSSRRGFQTPREMAGHVVSGWSDGSRKVVVERYDELRAWEFDLREDPGEEHPRELGT